MRYYREYIGEGQEEISRDEAIREAGQFYGRAASLVDQLDDGRLTSIRLPGGYISCEKS